MLGKICAGLLAATIFAATPASATPYDPFGQFVIAGGTIAAPTFAFGYAPKAFAGTVTPFTVFEGPNCGGDPNLTCAHLSPMVADAIGIYKPTAGFDAGGIYAPGFSSNHFENGFLNLHPSHDYWGYAAAVQFIAPGDGLYSFTGLFRNMDNGRTQRGVSAFVGTTSAFAATLYAVDQSFDFTAALTAGQTVTFLVDAGNDNYFNDTTGLRLQVAAVASAVPEPATWGMMLAGFACVGAGVRRQRKTLGFA